VFFFELGMDQGKKGIFHISLWDEVKEIKGVDGPLCAFSERFWVFFVLWIKIAIKEISTAFKGQSKEIRCKGYYCFDLFVSLSAQRRRAPRNHSQYHSNASPIPPT